MAGPLLKKALGQHHLLSGALCRPLIDFRQPAGERVLKVGPGGGVLTAELLAAGARVIGWEVDPEWAFALRRRLPGPLLSVVVGDALGVEWGRLPAPTLAAGNLPYNVATALIERMLPHHERVPRAAFLVQKEVADHLVAGPRDPAYGSLSAIVAAYAEVRLLGRVRRGSFRPPPKVEGAFVGFRLKTPPGAEGDQAGEVREAGRARVAGGRHQVEDVAADLVVQVDRVGHPAQGDQPYQSRHVKLLQARAQGKLPFP